MSRKNTVVLIAQQTAKKIVADQTRVRLMIGFDAAVIAAHETLQLGPGRAAAFANAYHDALDDLAELYLQDYKDKEMAYGKGKRDEVIRKILGEDNFVPYDRLYGGTYLDELGRIRALEQKEEK